ncbi:hypothetical protein BN1221_04929c [Brenneria goodwinii]|uniref:Uncharacterized protein n=1 Tax=Brenneria goodwinii TaxID=1109412 RepID=A0A0G4K370_9GAMM|nr:hypothetical protein BN1221_04929c [Brenneria goodwinii]
MRGCPAPPLFRFLPDFLARAVCHSVKSVTAGKNNWNDEIVDKVRNIVIHDPLPASPLLGGGGNTGFSPSPVTVSYTQM